MKYSRLFPLLFVLALTACASWESPTGATFVVVRHAEKANDGTSDPALSDAGLARAQALAMGLAHVPLVAAYATSFRRTRQTAEPTARAHGIVVTRYDANLPAPAFATGLRNRHHHGTVLVVGHSNTVPAIVSALCTCDVAALGDDDYDRIYTIHVGPDGQAVLQQGLQAPASTTP